MKYKPLWMVEHVFRSTKSLLETRPIWHKCDLGNLQFTEVHQDGTRLLLRSEAQGTCGRVFAAEGRAGR